MDQLAALIRNQNSGSSLYEFAHSVSINNTPQDSSKDNEQSSNAYSNKRKRGQQKKRNNSIPRPPSPDPETVTIRMKSPDEVLGIAEEDWESSCDELERVEENLFSDEEEEEEVIHNRTLEDHEEELANKEFQDILDVSLKNHDNYKGNKKEPRSRKKRKLDENCRGCLWSKYEYEEGQMDNLTMLLRIIESLCFRIPTKTVARIGHLFYKDKIYDPLIEGGTPGPMWRTWEIEYHIENHIKDPRFHIVSTREKYDKISKVLYKSLFIEKEIAGVITRELHEKHFKAFNESTKRIEDLLKLEPDKMNCYNKNVAIQLSDIGRIITPRFKTIEPPEYE